MATTPVTVVTGASSGIGLGFAERLAARGHDLVLTARRADRLEVLAERLRGSAGVTVHVLPADLADPEAPARITASLSEHGITPSGLVNAAGFGTAGPFIGEDAQRIGSEVLVNVLAPTVLTRLLLPSLLTAGASGLLVNVSSTASAQPVPNMAVYAATKAYVTSLTAAIWQETRPSGLRVLALCPGPTATEFFDAAGSDRFRVGRTVSTAAVLDHAFAALDGADRPVTTVGLGNRVQGLAAKLAPLRVALAVGHRATRRPGDEAV